MIPYAPSIRPLRAPAMAAAVLCAMLLLLGRLWAPAMHVAPLAIVPTLLVAATLRGRWVYAGALGAVATAFVVEMFFESAAWRGGIEILNAAIVASSYGVAVLLVHYAVRAAERAAIFDRDSRQARIVHDAFVDAAPPRGNSWRLDVIDAPVLGASDVFYHIATRENLTVVFVGTVRGRGIVTALLLAALRVLCEREAFGKRDTRTALERFNETLRPLSSNGVVCLAWLGAFDDAGNVRYSSAGAEPPLVRRQCGTLRQLQGGGTPLGAAPGCATPEASMNLRAGEALLLYSDGMAELLERKGLAVEDLFEDFGAMKERVAHLDRRSGALALLATRAPGVESRPPAGVNA